MDTLQLNERESAAIRMYARHVEGLRIRCELGEITARELEEMAQHYRIRAVCRLRGSGS